MDVSTFNNERSTSNTDCVLFEQCAFNLFTIYTQIYKAVLISYNNTSFLISQINYKLYKLSSLQWHKNLSSSVNVQRLYFIVLSMKLCETFQWISIKILSDKFIQNAQMCHLFLKLHFYFHPFCKFNSVCVLCIVFIMIIIQKLYSIYTTLVLLYIILCYLNPGGFVQCVFRK